MDPNKKIVVRGPNIGLVVQDDVCTIYFIRDLRKVRLDIRDENEGVISAFDFVIKARAWIEKNWEESWGPKVAPALFLAQVQQTNGSFPTSADASFSWEYGIAFGILFERLRQKLNLTINSEEFVLEPEEIEAELKVDE